MAYRILIVDDDIELLKMLKNYFEIKRYDVMMAEDGTDALDSASGQSSLDVSSIAKNAMPCVEQTPPISLFW